MVSDHERERIRLVEADYASTTDFIKSVVTTAAAMRGLAVTIWLGLVGFAIQQRVWELALLAVIVAAVFWILDGYHGWLYRQALVHAQAAEAVTASYYRALSRGEDAEYVVLDFKGALRSYSFGLYRSIRAFRPRDLLEARPTLFYRVLYPLLVGLAVVAAICVASGAVGS
jgi:hypothetical protein